MEPRRLPLLGAAAGALVGFAVVGGLVGTGVLERSEVVTGDEAREAFVAAWERSREASYTMEGTFEREVPGTGVLESAVFEAQRPPDRLRRGFGGIDGILDGRTITCATTETGTTRCSPSGTAADYQAEVDAEVARIESYVGTDPPLYDVASDGDECFLLQLRVAAPDPPYGRVARMCFDDDTGAMRFLQVETDSATDTFRASTIGGVSDVDFSLEPDDTYAARTARETTTTTGPPSTGTTAPPLTSQSDDDLFARCQDGGGDREVHAEMWDRGLSINDPRWAPAGGVPPCLSRGVLYYLEQLAGGG